VKRIRKGLTAGYSPLSPGVAAHGRHDYKWRLVINAKITKETVLA